MTITVPKLWIPKAKIIEPRNPFVARPRVFGFFKLEAIRPDGRRRLLADWFPNLITDAGLNLMGTSGTYLENCRVGSGSTAPNVADTALDVHVAQANSVEVSTPSGQSTEPYYGARTKTYRFNTGVATGNLTEIGVGQTISGTDVLFSRALILDGVGDPTTITVLSDETLDATYQVRLYPPLVDVEDTINISGDNYDYIVRAGAVTDANAWGFAGGTVASLNSASAHDGAIGAITTQPSGSSVGGTPTSESYGNNDLFRDVSAFWDLNVANFAGGIDAASFVFGASGGLGYYQVGFTPAIPKDNTKVLTLNMRIAWARGTVP